MKTRIEYRLGDVIQVLEALEILGMRYNMYKIVNYMNPVAKTKHDIAFLIEYEEGPEEQNTVPEELFE